ncbi:MAG: tetratricopeptide repeat protein, partial [Cetobacterium sp.]
SVAISIEPSMKEAYLGRGLAYRNLGRYNKAIDDIQIYMNYAPSVEGFLALGDIYLAEKKIDRAREVLQEGRRLYPQSKEISNMLTSTYSR